MAIRWSTVTTIQPIPKAWLPAAPTVCVLLGPHMQADSKQWSPLSRMTAKAPQMVCLIPVCPFTKLLLASFNHTDPLLKNLQWLPLLNLHWIMFTQWDLVHKKHTFHLVKRSARKPFTAFSKYRSPEKKQQKEGEDCLYFLLTISSLSIDKEGGLCYTLKQDYKSQMYNK